MSIIEGGGNSYKEVFNKEVGDYYRVVAELVTGESEPKVQIFVDYRGMPQWDFKRLLLGLDPFEAQMLGQKLIEAGKLGEKAKERAMRKCGLDKAY